MAKLSEMNNKTLVSGAVLALLAFGVGGYVFSGHSETEAAQGASQQAQAMPVNVMVAAPEPVQIWKEFSGRMVAVDYAEIRPQVSGTISEIKFQDGQDVEAGDVLLVIDPSPYEAAVAQAQAELAAAENEAAHAQRELKRSKGLIEKKAISQSLYDSRENAARVAQASLQAALARLVQAQINLDYAHVKAPISGRVSRAEITEGNLVEAGSSAPLLTSIVSRDGIYADFEVDESTYLTHIRNQVRDAAAEKSVPVKLVVGAEAGGEGMIVDGFIRSFDNRIDPASGTIRARAYFDNADGALLPGMFARVRLGSAQENNVIMMPERAIGTNQDKKFVYVVENGAAAYREVKIGDSLKGRRVIESGLQQGDQVIVDGVIRIRPGVPVSPQIVQK